MHKKILAVFFLQWPMLGLLFLCGFFLIARIALFGDTAFGYDTGIYRHIIFAYSSFEHTPALFFGWVARFFVWLGFSIDAVAYGGYVALILVNLCCVYVFTKRIFCQSAAWWASVFWLGSSVYSFVVFSYLYRSQLALFFVLLSLIVVHARVRYRLFFLGLSVFFLVSIHPILALPIVMILLFSGIGNTQTYAGFFFTTVVAICVSFLINYKEFFRYIYTVVGSVGFIVQGSDTQITNEYTGQFLSLSTFITYTFPFIFLAIFGVKDVWQKARFFCFFGLFVVMLYIVHIPFYTRYIFLFTLVVVVAAGQGMVCLTQIVSQKGIRYVLYGIFFALCVLTQLSFLFGAPGLSRQELWNIQDMSSIVPKEAPLILYSSISAPWVLGFSGHPYDHIIAPGVFDSNRWTVNQWEMFWHDDDASRRAVLFDMYEEDVLFVYVPPADFLRARRNFSMDVRMTLLGNGIWVYQKP